MTKVIEICDGLQFGNGYFMSSYHESSCCEEHYLSFSDLTMEDFDGLVFDLSSDTFFERIPNYGIALLPLNGHPVRIPGYGSNNGYYSSNLSLVLTNGSDTRTFDIEECQVY